MSRANTSAQVDKHKRIIPTTRLVATASTITVDTSNSAQYNVSALHTALTIANPTGYPKDGEIYTVRIRDDGTSRALTWGSEFRWSGTPLTATTVGKTHLIIAKRNDAETKWDIFINLPF